VTKFALVDQDSNPDSSIVLYKTAPHTATNSFTVTQPTTQTRVCPICQHAMPIGGSVCSEGRVDDQGGDRADGNQDREVLGHPQSAR
jgi:hypothetical protein